MLCVIIVVAVAIMAIHRRVVLAGAGGAGTEE
jgi:hypothetical protein